MILVVNVCTASIDLVVDLIGCYPTYVSDSAMARSAANVCYP